MINKLTLLISVVMLLCSCVDKAYDLSDIKTDDMVIGSGGLVVPMGDINIDLSEFFTPEHPGQPSDGQNVTLTDCDEVYDIGAGFDAGIIDQLTGQGTLNLVAMIDNPLEVDLKLSITFVDKSDPSNPVPVVVGALVNKNGEGMTRLETLTITPEMLEQIAASNGVRVQLGVAPGNPQYFDPNELSSNIKIRLSMKKTGGLKL